MEIKIRNGFLVKPEFLQLVERLLQTRSMPAKACLDINAAIDKITSQINTIRRTRNDIIMRYCVKDKDGIPVTDGNKYTFPDDKTKQVCFKEIGDVDKEFFTVDILEQITMYDDEVITPVELRVLGDLVKVVERPKE